MSKKDRSYTEVVASIETSIIYINNHLGNIDQHLDKLNDRTSTNEKDISNVQTRINLIYGISGGVLVLIGGLALFILKKIGIY